MCSAFRPAFSLPLPQFSILLYVYWVIRRHRCIPNGTLPSPCKLIKPVCLCIDGGDYTLSRPVPLSKPRPIPHGVFHHCSNGLCAPACLLLCLQGFLPGPCLSAVCWLPLVAPGGTFRAALPWEVLSILTVGMRLEFNWSGWPLLMWWQTITQGLWKAK